MASTFFKNWFNTSKTTNSKTKEVTSNKDSEDLPPLPPERRLSISKSGKMKRKNMSKQKSVTDTTFFAQPLENKTGNSDSVKSSDQVDNIDEVIADMLNTVENTRV